MKKVLLTSIGGSSAGAKPLSTSLISAILKAGGHEVIYFDTTFMDLGFPLDGEISDSVLQFKKVDWKGYNLTRDKGIDAKGVFHELIERERPDLIAASCMSDMYPYTIDFLRFAKERFDLPIILGGIHATLLPDEVIAEDCIDAVCIGEGEEAVLDFVEAVSGGRITRTDIKNLWIKTDGVVHRNPVGDPVDINALPFLDYSIYDPRQFLRPYEGRILRSGDVQDIRGCPRLCPYCANSVLNALYPRKRVRFYTPERFVEEAEYLTKTYDLQFFKIFSEDMFLRNTDDMARLSELYRKRVNVPFTSHAHPNTMTREKARLLKKMNCASISMALESGNYEYRKNVLKRDYTDEKYIEKVGILREEGIRVVALNMMGMPYETRDMIFDTFHLLKRARPSLANISMFFPYRGTPLGDLAIREGFVSVEKVKSMRSDMSQTTLDMPQIRGEDLNGIRKMSYFYLNYPEILYPLFRLCEGETGPERFLHKTMLRVDRLRSALKGLITR
jgi:anaerobic magnesium-protoporphyrin IX monomethyl ester cyclase